MTDKTALSKSHYAAHLDRLCKPPGSLGEIERIAGRLCEIQQTTRPATTPRHCTVFAADHGVTDEGVSAWPSDVTASVVELMQQARTASGVFATTLSCGYEVVDVGLLRPVSGNTIDAAVRRGTRNLRRQPAMTDDEFDRAFAVGKDRARLATDAGAKLLIGGEMGIGNTTSAACLIATLCHVDPTTVVGRGAGVDDAGLVRKTEVVIEACRRVSKIDHTDPKAIACELGGYEIVALAGYYIEAARRDVVVLLDGVISTAAAALANAIAPGTRTVFIAGHQSVEPAHSVALEHLGLSPLLNLNMRLGEATGALAALPLLDLAAAACRDMATLDELSQ